jgi:hypothetical protein
VLFSYWPLRCDGRVVVQAEERAVPHLVELVRRSRAVPITLSCPRAVPRRDIRVRESTSEYHRGLEGTPEYSPSGTSLYHWVLRLLSPIALAVNRVLTINGHDGLREYAHELMQIWVLTRWGTRSTHL